MRDTHRDDGHPDKQHDDKSPVIDTAEKLGEELGGNHRTPGRDGEAGDAISPSTEAQQDADDE